ncbi:MAG: hypothetical protein ACI9DC_004207 [Gammaproteobacteria bacterium]|jgi:hypothetical protein
MLSDRNQKVDDFLAKLSMADSQSSSLLPPRTKPGQCYASVLTPPVYKSNTKSVLSKEASEKIRVTAPAYEKIHERVLVKDSIDQAESHSCTLRLGRGTHYGQGRFRTP